jgi:hypothetical protein
LVFDADTGVFNVFDMRQGSMAVGVAREGVVGVAWRSEERDPRSTPLALQKKADKKEYNRSRNQEKKAAKAELQKKQKARKCEYDCIRYQCTTKESQAEWRKRKADQVRWTQTFCQKSKADSVRLAILKRHQQAPGNPTMFGVFGHRQQAWSADRQQARSADRQQAPTP